MRVGFKQSLPDRQLRAYAAVGGSLAVTISSLVLLVLPDHRWALLVWAGLALALCTAVGLAAPAFSGGEPPQESGP